MPPPIRVNGQEITWPELDTLTFEEACILYDYSQITLDRIADLDGLHPGVLAGLLHIAIKRAHRDRSDREIKQAVQNTNLIELLASLPVDEDDEADAVPPQQPPAGGEKTNSSETSSGNGSKTNSEDSPEPETPDSSGIREPGSSASRPIRLAG